MIPSASDMRRVSDGCRMRVHNPAFDHILSKAAKVVRDAAKQKFTSVAYRIPDYVQGFPIYKMDACAEYVANVFASKGYDVERPSEEIVVLRWEAEVRYGVPTTAGAPDDSGDEFSRLTL